MPRQGIYVCLLLYLLFPANIICMWWAVGSPLVMDPNRICKKSKRVGGKQQKDICRKEPEIVNEIVNGANMALSECRQQLKDRKWNCPRRQRSIAKVLRQDTKETAYINAISSAGVVHAVTQACTMGLLLQCTCDNRRSKDQATDGQWEWGGCGDDVKFGYRKSKAFMDRNRKNNKKHDTRTKLHLQNNEAGRLAVTEYMDTACKCHGLSGSCTLKTCWRKMPIFREVGRNLTRRYDRARKVTLMNDGSKLMALDKKDLSNQDLVFSSESPDYCKPNRKLGSQGTMGRECNATSGGLGGCHLLCCGRGYQMENVYVRENCKCKFKWCCEVNCEICITPKTIARCN